MVILLYSVKNENVNIKLNVLESVFLETCILNQNLFIYTGNKDFFKIFGKFEKKNIQVF